MCAVDFSKPNDAAFRHAVAAAKSRNAELNVVCAVPRSVRFNWQGRQRAALLAGFRRSADAEGVRMTVSVQHGDPAGVILLHANSSNSPSVPDLLVLGAPGPRGIDRFRFASVAERVLHLAPCPTLIARASEDGAESPQLRPFQRILCAVDFSPASLSALDEAIRVFREGGVVLRLLHVVSRTAPSVPRLAWEFSGVDFTEALADAAWRRLRRLLPLSADLYGRLHAQVLVGQVEEEITRAAADMQADVVVMGVTSRGRLARLFGSTTARLLRRSQWPVLGVPELTMYDTCCDPSIAAGWTGRLDLFSTDRTVPSARPPS